MSEEFSRKILGLSIIKIIKSDLIKSQDFDIQSIGQESLNCLIDIFIRCIVILFKKILFQLVQILKILH